MSMKRGTLSSKQSARENPPSHKEGQFVLKYLKAPGHAGTPKGCGRLNQEQLLSPLSPPPCHDCWAHREHPFEFHLACAEARADSSDSASFVDGWKGAGSTNLQCSPSDECTSLFSRLHFTRLSPHISATPTHEHLTHVPLILFLWAATLTDTHAHASTHADRRRR